MDTPPGLSVNDLGMELDMNRNTQGSSIVTLEPYTSPNSTGTKKSEKVKKYNKNENNNKNVTMQILPGVYELVSYNKYLIIQFEDGKCENVNVFKGNREIVNCCGGQPKVRSQMDGNLSVEVYSPEQSEKLMKMTQLVGRKVSVIPHPIFNQCRGVIYAPELLSIDAEEIQTELEDQNVTRVVRMRKKVQDQLVPLPTLILSFSTYKLPSVIKAGWLNFKVKPCIPSPIRCYHCQMYGHLIQKCKKRINQEPAVCQNCGKNAHGECNEHPSCIHCGEGHTSSSKNCSKYIFEKEVQAIKVIEKVTFKEARRKVLDRQIRPGEPFSSVMKNIKSNKQPQNAVSNTESNNQPPPAVTSMESNKQQQQPPAVSNSLYVAAGTNIHKVTSVTTKPAQVSELEPMESKSSAEEPIEMKRQSESDKTSTTTVPSKPKGSTQAAGVSKKIRTPNSDENKRKRVTTPDKKLDENNEKVDDQPSRNTGTVPKSVFKLKRVENTK